MFKTTVKTAIASFVAAVVLSGAAQANSAYVTEDLNFRTGPGVRYDVIAALPGCTRIHVYESYGGWYHATWNGIDGWVSANYVTGDPDGCYRPRYQPPRHYPRHHRHGYPRGYYESHSYYSYGY
jgi:uncharacterized protein YraI